MNATKSLLIFAIVGLFLAMAPSVWAGIPGDPGTQACEDAQTACQDAVDAVDPDSNHGAVVSACAQAANPALESGDITEECHSCVVSEKASKKKAGTNCGTTTFCQPGQVCGTFVECNPDALGFCACASTDPAHVSGQCVDDFSCATAEDCSDDPCPAGKTCYFDTCCGPAVCGPQTCTTVINGVLAPLLDSGPSAFGN